MKFLKISQKVVDVVLNLLYKHISNIPLSEILKCIFIVDDVVSFAATQSNDTEYKLYSVSNYKIVLYLSRNDRVSKFDSYIHSKVPDVVEQSAHFEKDGLRVVKYKTYNKNTPPRKHEDKIVINRIGNNRFKKLF